MQKLRLGTTFSGIGAVEHALDRMKIKHEIVFACDNGGIQLFNKKVSATFKEIDAEIEYSKKHINKLSIKDIESFKENLLNQLLNIEDYYSSIKPRCEQIQIKKKLIKVVNIALKLLGEKKDKKFNI